MTYEERFKTKHERVTFAYAETLRGENSIYEVRVSDYSGTKSAITQRLVDHWIGDFDLAKTIETLREEIRKFKREIL